MQLFHTIQLQRTKVETFLDMLKRNVWTDLEKKWGKKMDDWNDENSIYEIVQAVTNAQNFTSLCSFLICIFRSFHHVLSIKCVLCSLVSSSKKRVQIQHISVMGGISHFTFTLYEILLVSACRWELCDSRALFGLGYFFGRKKRILVCGMNEKFANDDERFTSAPKSSAILNANNMQSDWIETQNQFHCWADGIKMLYKRGELQTVGAVKHDFEIRNEIWTSSKFCEVFTSIHFQLSVHITHPRNIHMMKTFNKVWNFILKKFFV